MEMKVFMMVGWLKCPCRMAGGPLMGAEWPARGGHRHAARQLAESSGRCVHLPEQTFTPAIREGLCRWGFAPRGCPLTRCRPPHRWAASLGISLQLLHGVGGRKDVLLAACQNLARRGVDDAGSLVNTGEENFSRCFEEGGRRGLMPQTTSEWAIDLSQ